MKNKFLIIYIRSKVFFLQTQEWSDNQIKGIETNKLVPF